MRILLLLSLLFSFSAPAVANDITTLYVDGVRHYDQGEYSEAARKWEQALADGPDHGNLLYNLGNAYFRNNDLGRAIYYYRRAEIQSPRNEDISFNLEYARDQVSRKVEKPFDFMQVFSLKGLMSFSEKLVFLSILLFVFWILLILKLYIKGSVLRYSTIITSWVLGLMVLITGIHFLEQKDFGVVTVEKAKILSSIGKESVVLFELPVGSEFQLVGSYGKEWSQIVMPDGKKGWLKSSEVMTHEM